MTGVDIVHVPYKGAGTAISDLLRGQIQAMLAHLAPIAPPRTHGRLKLIAVTTARRSQMYPQVPTIDEAGITGFEVGSWFEFFAPAGTPGTLVEKIHADVVRQLREKVTRDKLAGQALDRNTPKQFAARRRAENAKFGQVLSQAGVKPE